MAVLRSRNMLWPREIPYQPPVPLLFEQALEIFKKQVPFLSWVPLPEGESGGVPAWVVFVMNSSRSCSDIGCQKKGRQEICLKSDSSLASALHEMMHCLGFEHEQFHVGYAWDRQDMPDLKAIKQAEQEHLERATIRFQREKREVDWNARKLEFKSAVGPDEGLKVMKKQEKPQASADFLASLPPRKKAVATTPLVQPPLPQAPPPPTGEVEPTSAVFHGLRTERNRLLYRSIVKEQNETYMLSYLEQMAVKEDVSPLTSFCDYDSIMMYGEFLRGAQAVQKQLPGEGIDTGGAGTENWKDRKRLSLGDIEALKQLYG